VPGSTDIVGRACERLAGLSPVLVAVDQVIAVDGLGLPAASIRRSRAAQGDRRPARAAVVDGLSPTTARVVLARR
jgi:hypothetical protein